MMGKAFSVGEQEARPSPEEMQYHLALVLQSPTFERSPRMQRFLRYLCEEMFSGRGLLLKEYSIAVSVFDKPDDFDPGTSATVRVEAGRLRRLLAQYQAEHGHLNSIVLSVPKGGYIPVFERWTNAPAPQATEIIPAGNIEPEVLSGGQLCWLTVLSCSFESVPGAAQIEADFFTRYEAFRTHFTSVVHQHGGTIDSSASARLTVYFGWPDALEDASGRAMTSALEILAYVRSIYKGDYGVRIGIATSRVLSTISMEQPLIIGCAPTLASKMLGQAPINGILVAEESRRLSKTAFETIPAGSIETERGEHTPLWRLLNAKPTTRFLASQIIMPCSLIGRREELDLLLSRWPLAVAGEGQGLILEGEAGIGKSRLSEAVLKRLKPRGVEVRIQCSPHHTNSALYPVVQLLRSLLRIESPCRDADDRIRRFLEKLDLDQPVNSAVLHAFLSQDEVEKVVLSASEQKEKLLQLLVQMLAALCGRRPVILLIEDIHWADPTMAELIGHITSVCADLNLYLIMTGRLGCLPHLTSPTAITVLRLARLPQRDCNKMIDGILGDTSLSGAARAAIIAKADGVPLYLEELTKLVLARDIQGSFPAIVPDSLNDLLASQLSCLGFARGIAQVATVIGRDFSSDILKAVTGYDRVRVDAALDQLLAAGILTRTRSHSGGRYSFRHALLRDAAYASILEIDRKELHYRVGTVLVDCFSDIAADNPEIIAGHMQDAGRPEEAIPFWLDAGRQARRRYALAEASTNFSNALDALSSVFPGRERDERELEILLELGTTMRDAEGYYAAGLKSIYERARSLSMELDRPKGTAASIYGLWTAAAGSGQWGAADQLAREFNRFICSLDYNDQLVAEGGRLLGAGAAFRGDFMNAKICFQRVADVYDPMLHGPSFGYDPGVASFAYLSWVNWHLGLTQEGRIAADRAISMAERLGHPATLSLVLTWLIFHAVCERDYGRIHLYNERLQTLCSEHVCRFWQPFGNACVEWALFQTDGQSSHFHRLLEYTKDFSELYLTSCLHILAIDICDRLGLFEEGLRHAGLAKAFITEHDERIWEGEYYRLLGQLHARWDTDETKGRHYLERARTVARQQQAVMLERRAISALECASEAKRKLVRTNIYASVLPV